MPPRIVKASDTQPGVYRHYKDGALYRVLFVVTDSTNARTRGDKRVPMVIYVSMTNGRIFARDEEEFNQSVCDDDGRLVSRFELAM